MCRLLSRYLSICQKTDILVKLSYMKIPLVDLKRQYQSIKQEIDEAMAQVLGDSAFILGKYTQEFEENFA